MRSRDLSFLTSSQVKLTPCVLAAIISVLSAGTAANASTYTVTMQQVVDASAPSGFDVVASGSGTINTSVLTFDGSTSESAQVYPNFPKIVTGVQGALETDLYQVTFISAPANFGPGTLSPPTFANTATGDIAGIASMASLAGVFFVPHGYNGTDTLSNTATWSNMTLASLGVTVGTYTWTWTNPAPPAPIFGAAALNNFTLNIVPLPGSLPLFLTGLVGLLLLGWRRKRKTAAS